MCDSPTLLTLGHMHASSIDKAALQSHVKAEASSLGFQLGWSVLFVMANHLLLPEGCAQDSDLAWGGHDRLEATGHHRLKDSAYG